MESVNFEFLRKRPDWQPLADLAGFTERYARPDPVAALVKLRSFGELLVNWIYDSLKLPRPLRPTLNDLLVNAAFQSVTPRVVLAKLHALRKEGDRAASRRGHRHPDCSLAPERNLRPRILAAPHLRRRIQGRLAALRQPPVEGDATATASGKRGLLEKLASQEAQMQKLLEELEAARSKAQVAELSLAEQQQALAVASQAADALSFDETTTRRNADRRSPR